MRGEYEEVPAITAGKRCGVQWAPWMDDFFTSWSPRNSNSNAEGPWDHWVDLAVKILQDPMTAIVRPDAHRAVQDVQTCNFYDEAHRHLTETELNERFPDGSG
ncbi:hypothetical protein [Streptomyces sp. NPDC005244]|uniref:hypothetical protein n=1 Tax=Streptomyces sp. NPDC005244 TaxID=3364708 RepID=UPI003675F213